MGRTAPFVLVGRDPLAAVAETWPRMWEGPGSPDEFDLHLGVLHHRRPSRVATVVGGRAPEAAPRALQVLRTLRPGPWWPSLDELMEDARSFYPGHLSAGQAQGR